jgi:DNA-binding transcriptional regulator YdaS (Cro superfamily)
MTPQQVIDHFKGQTAAARALGLAQSSVADWVASGAVPKLRQWQIELATRGALQADTPPCQTA